MYDWALPLTVIFLPLNFRLPEAFSSVTPLRIVAPAATVVEELASVPRPLNVAPLATFSVLVPSIMSDLELFRHSSPAFTRQAPEKEPVPEKVILQVPTLLNKVLFVPPASAKDPVKIKSCPSELPMFQVLFPLTAVWFWKLLTAWFNEPLPVTAPMVIVFATLVTPQPAAISRVP